MPAEFEIPQDRRAYFSGLLAEDRRRNLSERIEVYKSQNPKLFERRFGFVPLIEKNQWTVIAVAEQGFAFTIGLHYSFGFPELMAICDGLSQDEASQLLYTIVEEMSRGTRLTPGMNAPIPTHAPLRLYDSVRDQEYAYGYGLAFYRDFADTLQLPLFVARLLPCVPRKRGMLSGRPKPEDADSLFQSGIARYVRGEHEDSVRDFTDYVSLRPSDAHGYHRRALALFNLRKEREALADLDRAHDLKRGFTMAHYDRASVRHELGDHAGAREDMEACRRLAAPGFPYAAQLATMLALSPAESAEPFSQAPIQQAELPGEPSVLCLTTPGARDLTEAAGLGRVIQDAIRRGVVRIVLDLKGVRSIAPGLLAELVTWASALRDKRGGLALTGPTAELVTFLKGMGFLAVLDIADSVTAAAQRLRKE